MDNFTLLPLSGLHGNGKFAKVDSHIVKTLSMETWHFNKGGYAKSHKQGLMHRYVVSLRGENIKDMIVDHINGDRLDNRGCNLRVVTSKGNAKNKHYDPVYENLIGVVKVERGFTTVHKNVTWFGHKDPKMCALCYDSIIYYCYGHGKRLNDNISQKPLTVDYWEFSTQMMEQLNKIKQSYTDFKGVKKVKDGWKATIKVELGTFDTKEEAALAYNKAVQAVIKEPQHKDFNIITHL